MAQASQANSGASRDAGAGGGSGAPAPAARPRSTRNSRHIGRDLALIATFSALIAVCAILPAITIGGLVPITLQTFAVMLAGAVLGAKRGFLANLLYLAVGALGLPVFSMGRAGIEPFFGPSAGYLIAFPLAAALCGFLVERLPRKQLAVNAGLIFLVSFISSVLLTHTLGPIGLSIAGNLSLGEAFVFDLAFYPGDILKNIAMAIVAASVHRAFPNILPRRAPFGRKRQSS